jgi:CRP-like cAMP-binding protein
MRCWPFTLSNIWRNSYRLSWDKIDGLPPITPPVFDTAFVLLVIAVLLVVVGLCQLLAVYLKLPALNNIQLDRVAKLLRPRFTVPNERVVRAGDRGDAVFFIASGVVEVRLPVRDVLLGTGEFFGEMALLTGQPRQADVVALSYCRLLVLRKADFDRFVTANPDAGAVINRVAQARLAMNRDDHDRAAEVAS